MHHICNVCKLQLSSAFILFMNPILTNIINAKMCWCVCLSFFNARTKKQIDVIFFTEIVGGSDFLSRNFGIISCHISKNSTCQIGAVFCTEIVRGPAREWHRLLFVPEYLCDIFYVTFQKIPRAKSVLFFLHDLRHKFCCHNSKYNVGAES